MQTLVVWIAFFPYPQSYHAPLKHFSGNWIQGGSCLSIHRESIGLVGDRLQIVTLSPWHGWGKYQHPRFEHSHPHMMPGGCISTRSLFGLLDMRTYIAISKPTTAFYLKRSWINRLVDLVDVCLWKYDTPSTWVNLQSTKSRNVSRLVSPFHKLALRIPLKTTS